MAGVAAIIVAAGRGTRAGHDLPKQFWPIGGETMVRRALSLFVNHAEVGCVQAVIRPEDQERFRSSTAGFDILPPAFGGVTRQASVRAGLEALQPSNPYIVLIHDAARPFASAALVSRAIAAAEKTGAAIPALPVTDTIKMIDPAGFVGATTRNLVFLRPSMIPKSGRRFSEKIMLQHNSWTMVRSDLIGPWCPARQS